MSRSSNRMTAIAAALAHATAAGRASTNVESTGPEDTGGLRKPDAILVYLTPNGRRVVDSFDGDAKSGRRPGAAGTLGAGAAAGTLGTAAVATAAATVGAEAFGDDVDADARRPADKIAGMLGLLRSEWMDRAAVAAFHQETVMHRISTLRSFLGAFACVAALAALGALPASAELATWDQARVTELAKQLAAAGQAWELAVRQQPGADQVGSGDAQEGFGLLENARVLREMSQGLAGNLSAGKGYDKTVDMYKSLKEKVDDTEDDAQRAELDEPTMDAWSKFADAMRQIAPYYDPKANAGNQ